MHLSVDGRLDYFYFLAVRNNTATNICIQIFVQPYVFTFWGGCLGMELLGHMVNLCLIFKETAELLFRLYLFISHQQRMGILVSLNPTLVIVFLDYNHFSGYKVLYHLVGMKWFEFLVKCLSALARFFKLGCLFCESLEFFLYFGSKSF